MQLPKGYLKKAYELVRERGGLCISDEVQTGFGRLGSHFWGFEANDVVPDIGKLVIMCELTIVENLCCVVQLPWQRVLLTVSLWQPWLQHQVPPPLPGLPSSHLPSLPPPLLSPFFHFSSSVLA